METLPADWADYRRQWEFGHAIGFVLALTAFCTLLCAAFVEARAICDKPPHPHAR